MQKSANNCSQILDTNGFLTLSFNQSSYSMHVWVDAKELRDKVAAKKSWLHEQAKKHGFDTVSTATVCESICALETEVRSLSGLCRTVLCSRHCYGLVQAVWHRGRVPMVSMQIAAHAVVVSARRPGSTDARGM